MGALTERVVGGSYLALIVASLIYSVYLIAKFRNDYKEYPAVFAKRHPKLLCAFVTVVAASSFVATPLGVLAYMMRSSMSHMIASICVNQFFVAVVYKVFTLIWMVRYEIKLAQFTTHRKWKMYLDESFAKECWFVEHKSSMGRLFFASKVAMLVWTLFAVPYIILVVMEEDMASKVVLGCQMIPPIGMGIKVWWSTPMVTDVFHIRDQAVKLIFLTSTCVIAYAVLVMKDKDRYTSYYFGYMFSFLSPLFLFLLLDYPVRMYKKDHQNQESGWTSSVNSTSSMSKTRSGRSSWVHSFSIGSPKSASSSCDGDTKFMRRRSSMGRQLLRETLGNIVTFELFMEHLMKEFSYENLLFVIEVTQFKQIMVAKFPELKKAGILMKLPKDVPKSVKLNDDSTNFHEKAVYLYKKYVYEEAVLEVNLAYETRRRLSMMFDDSFVDEGSVLSGRSSESMNWTPTMSPQSTPRNSLPDAPELLSLPKRQSSEGSELQDMVRIHSDSSRKSVEVVVGGAPKKEKEPSMEELYDAFDNAYKQILTLLLDSLSRFDFLESESSE